MARDLVISIRWQRRRLPRVRIWIEQRDAPEDAKRAARTTQEGRPS